MLSFKAPGDKKKCLAVSCVFAKTRLTSAMTGLKATGGGLERLIRNPGVLPKI